MSRSTTIVFSATDRFAIYEAGDQVRFVLPDDYQMAKDLRKRISGLGGLRASIEDLRSESSISDRESTRAARELAWAFAEAFEDDSDPPSVEVAKEVLARVDARLRSLVKSHYRKKYAFANLIAFGAIEILLILVAFISARTLSDPSLAPIPHYAIYAALGGLGAFLSVIIGIRSIDVNIDLKRWEHIFAGATRILIGVIGGLVVGLALDSNLIDPTFGHTETEIPRSGAQFEAGRAMYFIFAFLAGFSESLVPDLLRRGGEAAGGTAQAGTPDQPIVQDMKP